ncbi:MAG TPA: hypothetical protein VMD28_10230 [Acidimicrobiales bacterium]|nr:hypothetical protein [Acidimicrobiales bacterium]
MDRHDRAVDDGTWPALVGYAVVSFKNAVNKNVNPWGRGPPSRLNHPVNQLRAAGLVFASLADQ